MTAKKSKDKLKENKKIYENKVACFSEEIPSREIIDTIDHVNTDRKETYTALLLLEAWPCLTRMYYKNNNAELTQDECYDIFLDAFFYLMEKKPWSKKDSQLNNDPNAFLKCMYTCCESRKKNYINSKFRDKRFVNYSTVSLDKIQEEHTDGSLTADKTSQYSEFILDDIIKDYILKYKYMEAIVLDIVLSYNIFNVGAFSYVRLKKMIKSFNDARFSELYDVPRATSSMIKTGYLPSLSPSELDIQIKQSMLTLQNDKRIKEILGKC